MESGCGSPIRYSDLRSPPDRHRSAAGHFTPGSQRSLRQPRNELTTSGSRRPSRTARSPRSSSGRLNARARGAPAAAAELAELAVRLTPAEDVDDARRRVLELADRLSAAGDADRAISLLEQALEGAPAGPMRAAMLTRLAGAVASLDDLRSAIDLSREALAEVEGDAALEAEIHLSLAGLVSIRGQHSGLMHAELAVEAASRAGDDELRCSAGELRASAFPRWACYPRAQMEGAFALELTLPQGHALGEATAVSRSSSSGRASSSAPVDFSRTGSRP